MNEPCAIKNIARKQALLINASPFQSRAREFNNTSFDTRISNVYSFASFPPSSVLYVYFDIQQILVCQTKKSSQRLTLVSTSHTSTRRKHVNELNSFFHVMPWLQTILLRDNFNLLRHTYENNTLSLVFLKFLISLPDFSPEYALVFVSHIYWIQVARY